VVCLHEGGFLSYDEELGDDFWERVEQVKKPEQ
jgi:hypothetical protein